MDVSTYKTNKDTVNIHLFTDEDIEEWKVKTGGEVTVLSESVCLAFKIGDVEIKLFSSDLHSAPEDAKDD